MAVRIESLAEPIPGYRLIDRIGGGGFGEVWKCEAPGGLLKAIKFVFGDLQHADGDTHRADQELKSLARVKSVRHPYILSLERFDIIDGQLLIVMELADRNLHDRYKECRAQGLPGIPREELLGYLEEAAEALDLMNVEYQLQHLDIKPQNLFLVHNHIKVADFGLVKDLEGHQASVTGGVTPVYAAPETFDGYVSRFSDQYSLAIVYQELLTGQRPFPGTNIRQLVLQHLQAVPNLSPLSPEDRPAIARALSKSPDDRHPSCRDLMRALRGAGSVVAVTPLSVRNTPTEESGNGTDTVEEDAKTPEPGSLHSGSDSANGTTQWIRAAAPGRSAAVSTSPAPVHAPSEHATPSVQRPSSEVKSTAASRHPLTPRPEINGDGLLFPALVVGVGQTGLRILQTLREQIVQRFGSLGVLPNLRFLLLDTDPEVLRAATRPSSEGSLTTAEILLAPLNRPTHYIKPRDGRIPVETWMEQKMLYRIPRSQVTGGVRALGRLAFTDNYRPLARRFHQELETLLDVAALQQTARQTRLGLRTTRPRVYVVAGLGGGTGSGAFLDLAYVLRHKLKQLGYSTPDVVGLLHVPNRQGRTRPLVQVNAFAALRELEYFGRPGTVFTARYHESEPALNDPDPPFHRCILLPGGAEGEESLAVEAVGVSAEYLFQELCQPLGREADLARAEVAGPPWDQRGRFFHTFGMYTFRSPARAVAREAARRVCRMLVERWMSKDSTTLAEPVSTWVREQWEREGWGPARLFGLIQEAARNALHEPPETAFENILAPVAQALADAPPPPGKGSRPIPREPDAALLGPALTQLERVLGPPEGQEVMGQSAVLAEALKSAIESIVSAWGQRVAEFAVSLIEEPQFRLAGAEEAVRQIVRLIEKVLHEEEPRSKDAAARAADLYARIRGLIEALHKNPRPRIGVTGAESVELLRMYAAWRYEALLAAQRVAVYVSLRGHLSDELREINFCRVRLMELSRQFSGPQNAPDNPPATPATPQLVRGPGRNLFPPGCSTLEQAVDRLTGALTSDDLLDLDGQVQAVLRERFTALVHICLTTANVVRDLAAAMRETAEAFVLAAQARAVEAAGGTAIPESAPHTAGAARLFLSQFAETEEGREQAIGQFLEAFDEAAPELTSPSHTGRGFRGDTVHELTVIAAPPGPAADALRSLARGALPQTEFIAAASPEDLIVYRERCYQPLCPSEQLGEAAETAYRQMLQADSFTPHSRTDLCFDEK